MNNEATTGAESAAAESTTTDTPKATKTPRAKKAAEPKAAAKKKAPAKKAPAAKPSKKAPAAKAPTKKKAEPKAEGAKRGRVSSFAGKKIFKLVPKNPRREGTAGHASFSLISNGMKYESYIEKGGRAGDLKFDVAHKYVEVK